MQCQLTTDRILWQVPFRITPKTRAQTGVTLDEEVEEDEDDVEDEVEELEVDGLPLRCALAFGAPRGCRLPSGLLLLVATSCLDPAGVLPCL